MVVVNEYLHEALDVEAQDIDIAALMAEMMDSVNQEKGYEPSVVDEIRIRKMMLASRYLNQEADHLKKLKAAVVQDWDARIKKKTDDIQSIKDFIESYLKNHNGGKKLALDVGTATLRRTPNKVKLDDSRKMEAIDFLKKHNVFENFQKPGELDSTLLQNSYIKEFEGLVEAEAEQRIAAEKVNGKVTKKREGEIKLEAERALAPDYFNKLPDFIKYIPEGQSVSITLK